jgi:predicted secreted protein
MYDRATHLTPATVAEVNDIKGPQIKGTSEDATSHSSGGWEEKIRTIKSGGKVSFDVNFISGDATHNKTTGLLAAAIQQTREKFQIVFPDASGFEFWAYADFDMEAKVKGKLTASLDLEITGAVTAL